eukprot:12596490-Ditylum_brightwellii.AAC.1
MQNVHARHAMLAVGYTQEEASIKNKRRTVRKCADRMRTSSKSTNPNDHTSSTGVKVTNITPSEAHTEKNNPTKKRKHDKIIKKWRKTPAMVAKDYASKIEQNMIKDKALREACETWKEQKVLKGGLTSEKCTDEEIECKEEDLRDIMGLRKGTLYTICMYE